MQLIGEFTVTSGRVRVTDPCYCPTPRKGHGGDGLEGRGVEVLAARNGRWVAKVELTDEDGSWGGGRVARLVVNHESYAMTLQLDRARTHGLFVDSGQMGVFDDAQFPREPDQFEYEDSKFYGQACNLTLGNDSDGRDVHKFGGCLTFGAVSTTGYGDGTYPGFIERDADGNAVRIEVKFIADDEEEEDDDDWDDDDPDDEDDDDLDDDEDEDDEPEDDDA